MPCRIIGGLLLRQDNLSTSSGDDGPSQIADGGITDDDPNRARSQQANNFIQVIALYEKEQLATWYGRMKFTHRFWLNSRHIN